MRLVFGISGASGMALARMALECYSAIHGLEIHLIISPAAKNVMAEEMGLEPSSLSRYAAATYEPDDFGAPMASGSWPCAGMIVCPCSMASLGAIANGCGTNLLHRAADVMLKERRPLVLSCRETPLNLVHLRNMLAAAEAGAIMAPFIPAFYCGDGSMQGAMRQFCGRMLDLLRIPHNLCERWRDAATKTHVV